MLSNLQNQVIEFLWSSILQYDLDDEAAMFCFQYQRQNKSPRWVKIYSNHVSYGCRKFISQFVLLYQ